MQHFQDALSILAALQIFFSIFLLKLGIKWTRFSNSIRNFDLSLISFKWFLFETQKYYIANQTASNIIDIDIKLLFYFTNGYIHNVAWTLNNVVKVENVETGNVASTISNVFNINVEINKVSLTLFNVANFNIDIHNVVSTLIWRCPAWQRHFNLTTTLKQRWNVCSGFPTSLFVPNVLISLTTSSSNTWDKLKVFPFRS